MATVIMDVSEKLGQHMLQGWVLTDHPCTTAGCRIPLLRSADSPVKYYCANCDEEKNLPGQIGKQANPPSASSSSSPPSRSSTPPTEVSSRASSPDFELPPETAESRYRMQQSDTASAEIGRRLLKGWAMLAEECISLGCFGVPLVRPPKTGGDKDPKKECVICGTVYVTQLDPNGFEQLIPLNTSHTDVTTTIPSAESSAPINSAKDKGKAKAVEPKLFNEAIPGIMFHQEESHSPHTFGQPPKDLLPRNVIAPLMSQNSSIPPLIMAATSLELSLHALSEKMLIMSNGTMPLDPPSIGITADAIGKVTEALAKVKQLHWSESRVGPA